jgi:hypothetical protein
MTHWEILSGLPPYGPPALNFSAFGLGMHCQGFVVRFLPDGAESWVGNFQPGLVSFHGVVEHPNGEDIVVIAGGSAYVISPEVKQCRETFGGQIEWMARLKEFALLVFASLTDIVAVGKTGIAWRSQRISWDGLSNLRVSGVWLTGDARSPFDDKGHSFRLNVTNGEVVGGSYPLAEAGNP